MWGIATEVFADAAREAAAAVEDNPWDSELVDDVSSPVMEHVDDNGIGSEVQEEVPEGLSEEGGVGGRAGGHVGVGDFGVFGEREDGDGTARLLVSRDGFLELKSVGECGDDGGFGSVRCESSCGVDHWDLMATPYEGEEEHVYRISFRNHSFSETHNLIEK